MANKSINVTDESKGITRTILLLAWPVFLEQIFSTLVSYADTAMVGSLGAWATASVSISNAPVFLLNGIIMALGVGITSLVARAAGSGDADLVRKLMRHAVMAILFIGLPICLIVISLHRVIPQWMGADPEILDAAAQYNLIVSIGRIFAISSMMLNSAFRGYGDTKTPLVLNTIMNVINVFFNFLLIYPTREITFLGMTFTVWGAGLEVAGAAIATAIGMFIAGSMALGIVFFRKNGYEISFKDSFRPDAKLCKQIVRISIPAMLERLVMSVASILVSKSVASLGTVSIAANSVFLTAESVSFMPAFAFQTAATTLVGQCLGAGKHDRAQQFVRATLLMGVVTMCFTGTGLYVFARPLIRIFTPDPEVIAISISCLRVVAFVQVPQVSAWIFSGVLRGAGDTKFNFYITATTNWFFRTLLPVMVIRVFHQGLFAVQFCILFETCVRLGLLYLRYRTGKWKYALDK